MRIDVSGYPATEPAEYRAWRPWFAWYPVLIGSKLVWLETVERRHAGVYPPTLACPYDHRIPEAIR